MKKFAWLAAGVAALGLGIFCACGDNTNPTPGGDGGNGDDDTPTITEQLGAFAETRWVSHDGMLDFANSSLDGAQSFTVNSIEGSGGESVINCTADGVSYDLSLNENGALEMRVEDDNTLYRTFMADATPFAGAWYSENSTAYYYVISSTVDENGYFSWKQFSTSYATPGDATRAVTVFEINADGSGSMSFYIPDAGLYYYYSGSSVYMSDGSSIATETVVPYTGVFGDVYVNDEGQEITIDSASMSLTYMGSTVTAQVGVSLLGAGIWFTAGETEYSLVYMNDGVFLVSENSKESYAYYDAEWLSSDGGEWSNGSSTVYASFENDIVITYDGNDYTLTRGVEGGELVYTFTAGDSQYTIRPVYGSTDVFELGTETGDASVAGYWFRESAKQVFAQNYTTNAEDLTVNSRNYRVTINYHIVGADDASRTVAGTFIWMEEMAAMALSFEHPQFSDNGDVSGSIQLNLLLANTNGIYWALAGVPGNYGYYSAYLTESYEAQAVQEITDSLEANDYFTTGGTNPSTIAFDFDPDSPDYGTVVLDGQTYYFSWGYYYIDENSTEPDLYLEINGEFVQDTANNTITYDRYILLSTQSGMNVSTSTVSIDTQTGDSDVTTGGERFYLAQSTFSALCDTVFEYNGRYETSQFFIDENGALNLSTYNVADGSSSLLTLSRYEYTLNMEYVNGREIITLTYTAGEEENTIVVTDRLYATVNGLVYGWESLNEITGTYVDLDGNTFLVVNADGTIAYGDSSTVTISNIETVDGAFVYTYTNRGQQVTATFNGTTVTIGGVTYSKAQPFTPESFVGTYSVGGVNIVISNAVGSVNERYALRIMVNNVVVPGTLRYVGGKQVLSFTGHNSQDFSTYRCTFTLDGSALSIVVNNGTPVSENVVSWSYSDFIVDDETLNVGEFTCTVKGGAPLYRLKGVLCDSMVVSIDEEGVKTLTLTFGSVSVIVTNDSDVVSVSVPGSDAIL